MNKEQYAVFEKEPAHGSEVNGVILAPFYTKEEAEQARQKYGYGNENYYVDKMKFDEVPRKSNNSYDDKYTR